MAMKTHMLPLRAAMAARFLFLLCLQLLVGDLYGQTVYKLGDKVEFPDGTKGVLLDGDATGVWGYVVAMMDAGEAEYYT